MPLIRDRAAEKPRNRRIRLSSMDGPRAGVFDKDNIYKKNLVKKIIFNLVGNSNLYKYYLKLRNNK